MKEESLFIGVLKLIWGFFGVVSLLLLFVVEILAFEIYTRGIVLKDKCKLAYKNFFKR